MHSRAARVVRGAIAAGFATFIAALSHVLAGGAAPSAFGLAASLVLAGAACVLLAGRTLSLGRLAASVVVAQAMFHGLFGGMGSPVATGHHHGPMPIWADAGDAADLGMLGAHLLAGAVTVAALRFGERAFWGLAETARMLLARLIPVAVPTVPTMPRVAPGLAPSTPRTILLLSSMRHRGPPVGAAA